MIELYSRYRSTIIGVQPVADDEVSRYGIIDRKELDHHFYSVTNLIEKPK